MEPVLMKNHLARPSSNLASQDTKCSMLAQSCSKACLLA